MNAHSCAFEVVSLWQSLPLIIDVCHLAYSYHIKILRFLCQLLSLKQKKGILAFPKWWASLTFDHLEYGWTRSIKRISNRQLTVILNVKLFGVLQYTCQFIRLNSSHFFHFLICFNPAWSLMMFRTLNNAHQSTLSFKT